MKIYLAGPCDTENRTKMVQIAKHLRKNGHEVYCPFELKIENAWDYSQEDWARKVFLSDIREIEKSEAIIVISLGRISSAGTNWEQGYAHALKIPTYVIQITDTPTSLMTYWGCDGFLNCTNFSEIENLVDHVCQLAEEQSHYHIGCKTILT